MIAGIISGLVQRQIERGFEPVWESDAYRADWRDGRDSARQGQRCPRWQTAAFRGGASSGTQREGAMKRIDRRLNAALIIGRAKECLARIAAGTLRVNSEVRAAWTAIAALPPDVDQTVIDGMDFCGNTWSACDSCGDFVSAVIEMGEEGYEVRTCRDCLIAALELLPEPREVMP